jgi:hypothetical protein
MVWADANSAQLWYEFTDVSEEITASIFRERDDTLPLLSECSCGHAAVFMKFNWMET